MKKPFYTLNNGRTIGYEQPCFVIAEIGINHNGSLEDALKLVDEAAKAGWISDGDDREVAPWVRPNRV